MKIPYIEAIGAVILLAGLAYGGHRAYGWAYTNGYNAANVRAEKVIGVFAKAEAKAQAKARKAEQALAAGVAQAQDEADKRNEQIEVDYQRRIAGVVSERDRLRKLWQAERATDELADSAAIAAAVAEQDRLRRESAARIVRAAETVQSERDEVIDRYEAVRKSMAERGR
jgi:hypothetical protein